MNFCVFLFFCLRPRREREQSCNRKRDGARKSGGDRVPGCLLPSKETCPQQHHDLQPQVTPHQYEDSFATNNNKKHLLPCCGFLKHVLLYVSSPVKKPPSVKALQLDVEPQRESSTESQSTERPVPSSLQHLIGQLAESAEDKYRLLEQIDKILRQGEATSHI